MYSISSNSKFETPLSVNSHVFKPFSHSKVQQLSVLKTYPKSKSSIKFDFDPIPTARPIAEPVTKSDTKIKSKCRSKSDTKPKAKRLSRHSSKQHK